MSIKTIDIQPGVSVLAVLRHLNYRPWFALGEFVDNSVESYLHRREELERIEGKGFRLRVSIDIDPTTPARITIRDNAAGIAEADYARAFRPAAIPPDRSGLCEFGMGMKSAACWFAPRWTVRTSAISEPVARSIHFNIADIVNDDIRELTIRETPEKPNSHFTAVTLEDVFHVPVGRTVAKLKEHLTDIYRGFIRDGLLELRFGDEVLAYREPKIFVVPQYKDKNGPDRVWRKDIEFDLGDGLRVHGFAALRETASVAKAGFALFRRGRVIQGSGDEGYRPPFIFGNANSYRYQRLFGELHLDGFDVSHTKDGFRWDENEQPFLELLKEHLDSEDLPLLRQAENYRVRASRVQLEAAATKAVANTAQAMEDKLPDVLPVVAGAEPVETPSVEAPQVSTLAGRRFDITFRGTSWEITVELSDDLAETQWLCISDTPARNSEPRKLHIRVSMVHPFMVRFAQNDSEDVEALLRVAAALGLAEVLARDSGVRLAGTVRRNVNDLLRDAFSEA